MIQITAKDDRDQRFEITIRPCVSQEQSAIEQIAEPHFERLISSGDWKPSGSLRIVRVDYR